jgi:hypothetical protein
MPMLDAYIPQDALSPDAERRLIGRITDVLLEHEGVDPTNERARRLAWVGTRRREQAEMLLAPSDREAVAWTPRYGGVGLP